jgi:hypothetical protein
MESPACSSLDTSEECLELHEAWREATHDEKHEMGVKIGNKISQLLRSETRSAAQVREDLAKFVRSQIIGRRGRSKGRGRSQRKSK